MVKFITKVLSICSHSPIVEETEEHFIEEIHDTGPVDIISLESEIKDVHFIRDLLCEMKDDVMVKMESLDESISANDYQKTIISAHSIKGIALSMKCDNIANSSSKIEKICMKLSRGDSGVSSEDLSREMYILKDDVNQFYVFQSEYIKTT